MNAVQLNYYKLIYDGNLKRSEFFIDHHCHCGLRKRILHSSFNSEKMFQEFFYIMYHCNIELKCV